MMRGAKTVPESRQPKSPTKIKGGAKGNGKPWSHGLCACCDDCGEICSLVACPCIYLPIVALRGRELPAAFLFGGPVPLRTKIREERKIDGTVCGDCCTTLFCPCCVIIQMSKEARDTEPLL